MRPPLGICEPDPGPWLDPANYKQENARRLCAPCPVLDQCRAYAASQPGWHGVIIAGWYAPAARALTPYPDDGRTSRKRHPALSTGEKDALVLAALDYLPWWYHCNVEARLVPDGDCLLWADEDGRITGDWGFLNFLAPIHRTARGFAMRAHRVAYLAHHGPIPEGGRVWRTCGQKGCCAPDHLTLTEPDREDDDQ